MGTVLHTLGRTRIRTGIDKIDPCTNDQTPLRSRQIDVLAKEAAVHDVRLRPSVEIAGGAGHVATEKREMIGALASESVHISAEGQAAPKARQNVRL